MCRKCLNCLCFSRAFYVPLLQHTTELVLNMLAEVSTTDLSKENNPSGMIESAKIAKRGGSVARAAREQYESQSGKKIVTPLNAKNLKALNDNNGGGES